MAQNLNAAKGSQAAAAENTTRPFSIKDKIGYMMGDFANDIFFMMASSFLMVFYTNVLGIPGALVGTLFLVSRCVDAFTDIGMGRLVDRSKVTKEGRYRPWIRRGMIPVVFAGVLLFIPYVANLPYVWRVVYIFVTYILWGSFAYTAINIPYGSMAAVMTDDPVQRSALSTFRSLGATAASVLVMILLPMFVYTTDEVGNQILMGDRVFYTALAFAVIALAAYWVCYKNCQERLTLDTVGTKKQSPMELINSLITNRALVSIIVAAIVLLLATLLTQSMSMYLFMDYYKDMSLMSIVGAMSVVVTLILAPLSGKITQKVGKKEASSLGLLLSAVVYAIMFSTKITNGYVYLAFMLVASLGTGLFNLMIWAFISDIIDYQTVKTGSNDGGTIYGVYSFARKIGQALAGGLGGFVLSIIGYQYAVAGQVVVQTEAVTDAIYAVCTGVPAVCYFIIALILMFWYPLSKKKVAEVKAQIDAMEK